jgi:YqjK-like protein
MTRAQELAQKRQRLQLQCALQRQELAHLANDIEARLVSTDRVIDVVSSVVRNPAALIAVIAGTLILGPWRIMKWVSQGAMLFNLAKRVQQWVAK